MEYCIVLSIQMGRENKKVKTLFLKICSYDTEHRLISLELFERKIYETKD
jgi:hypothetical protein